MGLAKCYWLFRSLYNPDFSSTQPPFPNPERPPPDPEDLCLPRLNKSTWSQKIDRLPIPPQHRTLLWSLALNRVPFRPQNATNCSCGSLETTAHLAGSCPLWSTFLCIFLNKWTSLASDVLDYLATKHLIPISPEMALPRIRIPHLWIALPLLEWPHIQDFDDPVVNLFRRTWALAASTLLYNIWMARNDLAYQNNL
ncbi:hypothetical protein IWQ61_008707, partial [Dispira simplex]